MALKLSGKELMLLGAGLMLFSITLALSPDVSLGVFDAIYYYVSAYLPIPAGIVFLVGWFRSLYE